MVLTYAKTKIDKTQKNRKCRLYGDWDETINHKINECGKEYKTRLSRMGKVINTEFYKKFKFDHTNKWYMHNPELVLENDMHKLLRDFEIQMDHLARARWTDLEIATKKKKKRICQIVDIAVLADNGIKLKESENRNKYLDFGWEKKEIMEK